MVVSSLLVRVRPCLSYRPKQDVMFFVPSGAGAKSLSYPSGAGRSLRSLGSAPCGAPARSRRPGRCTARSRSSPTPWSRRVFAVAPAGPLRRPVPLISGTLAPPGIRGRTGCRRNEVVTLQWDDVDRVAGELRLRECKTGAHEGTRRAGGRAHPRPQTLVRQPRAGARRDPACDREAARSHTGRIHGTPCTSREGPGQGVGCQDRSRYWQRHPEQRGTDRCHAIRLIT